MAVRKVRRPSASPGVIAFVLLVALTAVALGAALLIIGGSPALAPTAVFVVMGMVSFNLRVPDVGSKVTISFLSVVLLASAVIIGPFGAWLVGVTSVISGLRRATHWYQRVYNMAMFGLVGALGGLSYRLVGGAPDVGSLSGAAQIGMRVGLPLLVADIVLCVANAVLLAGVVHIDQGHPFMHMVRQMLATTGASYIGYGVISFLFVVLWYPAHLGAVSALFILAPLLVARWAFIQYVDEMRSHQRIVDTLVTALGTKHAADVDKSRRTAQLAEWVAEELGLSAQQVANAQHVAMLHRLGELGVGGVEQSVHEDDPVLGGGGSDVARARLGARMIDGIEFLEPAGPGIEHQHDAYDGRQGTLAGHEIPISARIVAVATTFESLAEELSDNREAMRRITAEAGGRFDPDVVAALDTALQRHPWPPAAQLEEQEASA